MASAVEKIAVQVGEVRIMNSQNVNFQSRRCPSRTRRMPTWTGMRDAGLECEDCRAPWRPRETIENIMS